MPSFEDLLNLYVNTWPVEVLPVRLYQLGVVSNIVNKVERKKKLFSTKTKSTFAPTHTVTSLPPALNTATGPYFPHSTSGNLRAPHKKFFITKNPPISSIREQTSTDKLPELNPIKTSYQATTQASPVTEKNQVTSEKKTDKKTPKKNPALRETNPNTPEADWERYCGYVARHNERPMRTDARTPESKKRPLVGGGHLPAISEVFRDLTTQRKELHRVAEELKRVLVSEGSIAGEEDVRETIARKKRELLVAFAGQISDRIHNEKIDVLNFFADVDLNLESTLIRELAKNHRVSLARVAEVEHIFEKIAGPGKALKASAFEGLMEKLSVAKVSPSQIEAWWKTIDARKTGEVKFKDFAAFFFSMNN